MRINKFLSDRGVCSRREADRRIEAGRVTINGEPATLGQSVTDADQVAIDGKPIDPVTEKFYLMLNKPAGVVCTTAKEDPDNIIDYIGFHERVYPVGRLDKASVGLILLTNDGAFMNELLRSRNEHEKVYRVTVDRPFDGDFLEAMASGVEILDTRTKPCEVKRLGGRTFEIVLTQGLNRQIRRMCEALGYQVVHLERIKILSLELGDLPRGEWRHIPPKELERLKREIGVE
jgi:23S rRNA pseudouridine2604 synthase